MLKNADDENVAWSWIQSPFFKTNLRNNEKYSNFKKETSKQTETETKQKAFHF